MHRKLLDVYVKVGGIAALFVLAALPAGAASGPSELATLLATWAKVDDYQATIVADEFTGDQRQERRFHFSFMRPDHVKAEIVDGFLRGMVAIWNGGDRVIVYHHGMFSGLRKSFDLHDRIVTSPRGNTVASADFSQALQCYEMHPELVHVEAGPIVEGVTTTRIFMEAATPLQCPGYSPRDQTSVTKDELVIDDDTSLPLRHLRYVGERLVEQWDIRDLRVNTGLTESDFR